MTVGSGVYNAKKLLPDPKDVIANASCTNCNPVSTPYAMDIITGSPFSDILQKRQFTELKRSRAVTSTWTGVGIQAVHVTPCLLSGAILTNIGTKQNTVLNKMVVKGRDGILDCHKEQTREVKGVPRQTSVPSTTGEGYYPRVTPVTIHSRDGIKLINGSKTCGILVTSSIRLDKVLDGSISEDGGTHIFDIPTSQIKNIRIFVDTECLGEAKKLKRQPVKKITKNLRVCSPRQIRSSSTNLTRIC